MRYLLLSVVAAATAVLLPGAATAPLRPINSVEACGRCHRSIVEAWKESSHARAVDRRLFQDALEIAEQESGPAARRTCLECHAPLAISTNDLALERKTSWEGISCDYCHSVQSVAFVGGQPKPKLEFGAVKSGPMKEAFSGAHLTAYSPVHVSSNVCAPCHEYRNAQGFPVLTTFSEWQASRHGRQSHNCQSCHMSEVAGDVADIRLTRKPGSKINLHRMPGSRSLEQLNRAVKAKLSADRVGDTVRVTVEMSNAGAGHHVPTGSPLRQLLLDLQLDSNQQRFTEHRIYARTVADASGKPIEQEAAAFLKAARVITDTRLAPDEVRREVFTFKVPAGQPAQVKATLSYFYSPTPRMEGQRRVSFLDLRTTVK